MSENDAVGTIAMIRAETGCGLIEAARHMKRDRLRRQVANAKNLEDLRQVVAELVEATMR